MTDQLRWFVDTDIILDALLNRADYVGAARDIFEICDMKPEVQGLTSPLAVSNALYVYYNLSPAKANKRQTCRKNLAALLESFELVDMSGSDTAEILNAPYGVKDFEDALQLKAAIGAEANYLITRNVKDYETSQLQVVHSIDDLLLLKALSVVMEAEA